jgi:hypothetical protein
MLNYILPCLFLLFEEGQMNIPSQSFCKICQFVFSGIVHIKKDGGAWKAQNYKSELMSIVKKG